jgi:hypothetical protein
MVDWNSGNEASDVLTGANPLMLYFSRWVVRRYTNNPAAALDPSPTPGLRHASNSLAIFTEFREEV